MKNWLLEFEKNTFLFLYLVLSYSPTDKFKLPAIQLAASKYSLLSFTPGLIVLDPGFQPAGQTARKEIKVTILKIGRIKKLRSIRENNILNFEFSIRPKYLKYRPGAGVEHQHPIRFALHVLHPYAIKQTWAQGWANSQMHYIGRVRGGPLTLFSSIFRGVGCYCKRAPPSSLCYIADPHNHTVPSPCLSVYWNACTRRSVSSTDRPTGKSLIVI